jgi:hypothetical protein
VNGPNGRRWIAGSLIALAMSMASGCGGGSGASCPNPEGPYFSVLPFDDARIEGAIVLGQINPPGDVFPRGQTGFRITQGASADVVAAGDLLLGSVESNEYLESPFRQGVTDYMVTFLVDSCRHVRLTYGHLETLSEALTPHLAGAQCEQYSTDAETVEKCSTWLQDRNVVIPAGTVIGTAGTQGWGLDFDAFDDRVEHAYIAPHRPPSQYLTAICTIDLFEPTLRSSLEARVGRAGVTRTATPVCGTMEIDVPGTAKGMWVVDGQDVELSGETARLFFALADDDVLPTDYLVLATGHESFDYGEIGSVLYAFEKQSTGRVNRDFGDLSPDGDIHCYQPAIESPLHFEIEDRSFFVALEPDGKLKLEPIDHAPGASPCADDPATWELGDAAITLMR